MSLTFTHGMTPKIETDLDNRKQPIEDHLDKIVKRSLASISETDIRLLAESRRLKGKYEPNYTEANMKDSLKHYRKRGYKDATGNIVSDDMIIEGAIINNLANERKNKETHEDFNESSLSNFADGFITDPTEKAMFMAMSKKESNKFRDSYEMGGVWKGYMRSGGNKGYNDAFNYRGRGYLQLTGKTNYKQMNDWFKNAPSDSNAGKLYKKLNKGLLEKGYAKGFDLVANPDLAANPSVALEVARLFWSKEHGGNIRKAARDANVLAVQRFIRGKDVVNWHRKNGKRWKAKKNPHTDFKNSFNYVADERPNKDYKVDLEQRTQYFQNYVDQYEEDRQAVEADRRARAGSVGSNPLNVPPGLNPETKNIY